MKRPENENGLALAPGAAHRPWANFVNALGRRRGDLFDGRLAPVAMDETHLLAAARYAGLDPVRGGWSGGQIPATGYWTVPQILVARLRPYHPQAGGFKGSDIPGGDIEAVG